MGEVETKKRGVGGGERGERGGGKIEKKILNYTNVFKRKEKHFLRMVL